MMQCLVFIISFFIFSNNLWSASSRYELNPGVSFGGYSYPDENRKFVSPSIEMYTSLLIDDLKIGLGVSYARVNLGTADTLIGSYPAIGSVSDNTAKLNLVPAYLSLKYQRDFSSNFAMAVAIKAGLVAGSDNYYYTERRTDKMIGVDSSSLSDKGTLDAGSMYGITVSTIFYTHYSVAFYYDIIQIKNSYERVGVEYKHYTSLDNLTMTGLRLSYIIQ